MKTLIITISILLLSVTGITRDFQKTILISADTSSPLRIENIFISPQPDHPPIIAFYGEDGKTVFLYNFENKTVKRFTCQSPRSSMSMESIVFVTFCWDQEDHGRFAVVFSKYGQRLVFQGEWNGPRELKKYHHLPVKTTAFTYREGLLYFLDLEDGIIRSNPGKSLPGSFKPRQPNRVIADFKLIQETGEPYFVLRDIIENRCFLYGGIKTNSGNKGSDELYPHVSPNGKNLAYIERDKRTGSARVCFKQGDHPPMKSQFSFALEENALLREYKRMYWLGNKVYYFIKEPDLNSKQMTLGLRILSKTEDRALSYSGPLISTNDTLFDVISGDKKTCLNVRRKANIRTIIPFRSRSKTYYIFLLDSFPLRTKTETNSAWVFPHPIIINNSLQFTREEQ